jgi:hypothetical protein
MLLSKFDTAFESLFNDSISVIAFITSVKIVVWKIFLNYGSLLQGRTIVCEADPGSRCDKFRGVLALQNRYQVTRNRIEKYQENLRESGRCYKRGCTYGLSYFSVMKSRFKNTRNLKIKLTNRKIKFTHPWWLSLSKEVVTSFLCCVSYVAVRLLVTPIIDT